MKKRLFSLSALVMVGLGLSTVTLTSCSSDDNSVYNINVDKGKLTAVTFEEITVDTGITINDAAYTWFDHTTGQVISKEAVLKHAFKTPGEHKISLKIEHNSKTELYSYLVEVSKSADYDYITLDLSAFDLGEGIETAGGYIWDQTFTEKAVLQSDVYTFNHMASAEGTYWSGFTVSSSTDNANHADTEGGWAKNQWGTMAKGSVEGHGGYYLVAYADQAPAGLQQGATVNVEDYSAVVTLDDEAKYQAISTQVAMSPWAYYSITEGDDFATKFETGDYFALKVYGVDADMKLTAAEPVTHYFVDFRNGVNTISKDWNKVDLSSLGEVKYLLFFLDTTDKNAQGYANTALYFTMDQLTVNPVQ